MNMERKDILKLLTKYRAGDTLTKTEKLWLDSYYLHRAERSEDELSEADLQENLRHIESVLWTKTHRTRPVPSIRWRYVAVAASLLFILSISIYFYRSNRTDRRQAEQRALLENIMPGTDKAVLELANGEQVLLDGSQPLSMQGNTMRIGIQEISLDDLAASTAFNTLRTPNGGQFQLLLEDGSTVWLNAGSQLRYPTRFGSDQREVELVGEAYFEVSHDPKRPFRVKTDEQHIHVLGTGFNIRAYPNRRTTTTLAHGKVKIDPLHVDKGHTVTLNPGEQAVSADRGLERRTADVGNEIAWKNGYFSFKKSSLQDITEELARWYEIDFVFEGQSMPTKQITGQIPRNVNLYDVAEIFAYFDIDCAIKDHIVYLYVKK